MLGKAIGLIPVLFLSAFASAQDVSDIQSLEIREVFDSSVAFDTTAMDSCGKATPSDVDGIGWSDIVTIGEQVWKVVEANKPVVNVGTAVASALPNGLGCWMDLAQWQPAPAHTYDATYKNKLGSEVVKFRFRLQYVFGGNHLGTGKYLANVTILPVDLSVLWGYTFDANVEVEPAVNVGTKDMPVAGLGMNLKWTVKTVLTEIQSSEHFFVQGDGKLVQQ